MQENLDAYVRGQINASARRVLFTKLVGEAWDEVISNKEMIVRSFRQVGIAIAVDGSEDGEINIEGLLGYKVEDSDDEGDNEEYCTDEDPFADCTSDDEFA